MKQLRLSGVLVVIAYIVCCSSLLESQSSLMAVMNLQKACEILLLKLDLDNSVLVQNALVCVAIGLPMKRSPEFGVDEF